MSPDGLLTAAELAAVERISVDTVRRLARAGLIPCVNYGRGLARYDLEAVRAARRVAARAASVNALSSSTSNPTPSPDLEAWAKTQQQRERRGVAG